MHKKELMQSWIFRTGVPTRRSLIHYNVQMNCKVQFMLCPPSRQQILFDHRARIVLIKKTYLHVHMNFQNYQSIVYMNFNPRLNQIVLLLVMSGRFPLCIPLRWTWSRIVSDDSAESNSWWKLSNVNLKNPILERISRPHTPTGILEVQSTSTTATGPPHSPTSISSTDAFSVTVQYPSRFSKSCSEGDLSADTLSPIAVNPTRNLRVSVEEDVETTTTGSDIEVMSCCTSTNGESLPVNYQASLSQAFMTTHSNDVISCSAGKAGRQFDASQLTVNIPAAFRGHSAPMASSHSCLRRHRRAVSQDYRFGHCGPNEEDLFFAFQRLSKSYSDKKHLLGVREAKILELSRENCELRDANSLLQAQLRNEDSGTDVSSLTGEFSKRLAKTELQLRMVTRERDQLKASLAAAHSRIRPEKCTNSCVNEEMHLKKISELERCLQDKTNQLEDLLKEGEKLSQNQLKTNNVLKKLHKEKKEIEQRERNQMDKIEQLNANIEALQTNLHQKEDAIKELTGVFMRTAFTVPILPHISFAVLSCAFM
ncbi:hypothetical protein AHF37_09054 [Paragonimus kellicotti]|nr:hypothetical protein AHF37_09054 [Paragonimus kellicotti]